VKHPVIRWMAATLDGVVAGTGAVYEAKFMLPWSFSEEFAAEKYMAQLQHNMWVTTRAARTIWECGKRARCGESERTRRCRDIPFLLREPETLVAPKAGSRSGEVSRLA
jgi:hypothetical protein